MKVLVTGATGNTGHPLTRLLAEAGATVRAASRRAGFDWSDPATHDAVLDGVERMYLVAPVGVAEPEPVVRPFLERARDAGVRRVVLLSSSAVSSGDPGLGRVDRAVREIMPEFAVLRPSWFMQNFTGDHPVADGIRTRGEIVTATGEGRIAFVDAADIAASAAALLLADECGGEEHVITGPEAISYAEAAAVYTEVTGVPVRHTSVSAVELADRFVAAGYPADFAAALAALDDGIRRGSEDRVTGTVHRLTGRPPKPLRRFLTERLRR
ncbi:MULTISPECIES: ergot alkaloid biosynthesis protein [Amycolatopsis]|uniref:ergot alkaloid biosynthesis protein n=1 Tax=Amycolatopsis TaxID=1813 RepID=UPI000B8B5271|nr:MULTISPECIES: ergot alkaloid biosynthesis protein [Amycolatopsis]OXM72545.1 ergot alkaloid biosynthesis protein [Amycolatopsis sp. KNN50.9b]